MWAENETTGHNRYVRFVDLPVIQGIEMPDGLTLDIRYKQGGAAEGVVLDNVIIPAILQAFKRPVRVRFTRGGVPLRYCPNCRHDLVMGRAQHRGVIFKDERNREHATDLDEQGYVEDPEPFEGRGPGPVARGEVDLQSLCCAFCDHALIEGHDVQGVLGLA